MTSKEWADRAISDMKRVQQAASAGARNKSQPQVAPPDHKATAETLAEALKSDNATTQAIAIRISNLAAKYPNKAY